MTKSKSKNKDIETEQPENKSSTLDIALKAVKKKHGAAVRFLSDVPEDKMEFIPTGSISLDAATGGGLLRGRMVEIFGWEGSGKSTLAMSIIAEANNMGHKALYIDAERALDPRLPVAYGVDPSMFIWEDEPFSAERHFEIINDIVGSGDIGVCVVDSVSSLIPSVVKEGEVGKAHIGQLARFLSQECPKLIHLIGNTNTLFIFINQYREKIMTVPGDPRTTSGGNAVKFYSSYRIEVAGSGKTKSGAIYGPNGETVGHHMKFRLLKNKTAIPFKSGAIDLIYGKGYDTIKELVDTSVDLGLIESAGSWFTYKKGEKDEIKCQGKGNMAEAVINDNVIRCSLLSDVKSILGLKITAKEMKDCKYGVVDE